MYSPPKLTHISPIYTLYFLYIDPLLALIGSLFILTSPLSFLRATIPPNPSTTHPLPLTPTTKLLLTNIAVMYLLISILQGIVLRLTRERNVWVCILAALMLVDVGHLYANWEVAPQRFVEVGGWTKDEWVGNGTLVLGAALRFLFVLGVGRR